VVKSETLGEGRERDWVGKKGAAYEKEVGDNKDQVQGGEKKIMQAGEKKIMQAGRRR
jgi:hypothetical protein